MTLDVYFLPLIGIIPNALMPKAALVVWRAINWIPRSSVCLFASSLAGVRRDLIDAERLKLMTSFGSVFVYTWL